MATYLNELSKRIVFAQNEKGFKFDGPEVYQKLLLAVSEICEAQGELRDGHSFNQIYFSADIGFWCIEHHATSCDVCGGLSSSWERYELPKPEGFPIEMIDGIIRLLHICGNFDIDIDAAIELKLAYNASRPMKHGRQF